MTSSTTPATPSTAPAAAPGQLLWLAPGELMVDQNIRHALHLDKAFVASIAEVGVLEPIVAVRTDSGHVRVRHGHRRTVAAVQAGRENVPVFLTGTDAADTATEAARLVAQHAENQHRTNLSDAEELDVIAGLADLGVSAAAIAKRTKLARGRVDHALAAARSELARTAATRYDLTIPQAAVLAEFADDPDTVAALVAAAPTGRFDHLTQLARNDRALAQQAAEVTDQLRAAGATVLDTTPREHRLDNLRSTGGDPLTETAHRDCPGHAAVVETAHGYVDPATRRPLHGTGTWDDDGEPLGADSDDEDDDGTGAQPEWASYAAAVWVCTDPDAHGHQPRWGRGGPHQATPRTGEPSPEQAAAARAARRDVIVSNKAWHAARQVRRDWLHQFATRKTAPKGSALFLALTLAQHPDVTHGYNGHQLAADLLNGTDRHDTTHPVGMSPGRDSRTAALLLAGVTDGRAHQVALVTILAGYEADTPDNAWRSPTDRTTRYLLHLAELGYPLSDVERRATGQDALPAPDNPAQPQR